MVDIADRLGEFVAGLSLAAVPSANVSHTDVQLGSRTRQGGADDIEDGRSQNARAGELLLRAGDSATDSIETLRQSIQDFNGVGAARRQTGHGVRPHADLRLAHKEGATDIDVEDLAAVVGDGDDGMSALVLHVKPNSLNINAVGIAFGIGGPSKTAEGKDE
jgi:hypothetical protein